MSLMESSSSSFKVIHSIRMNIVDYLTRDNIGNIVLLFVVAALYTGVAVAAILLLRKSLTSVAFEGSNTQRLYLFFLIIQTIIRSIFFWMLSCFFFVPAIKDIPDGVWFILLTIGCDFFFSTYIILVYYWAKMYHFSRGGESISSILIVILNAIVYFFQISEYVLFFFDDTSGPRLVESFSNFFNACFSLSLAFGMCMYAWKLYHIFGKPTSRTLQKGARLLASVAGICTTCFTIRATILVVDTFVVLYPSIFIVIYFVISELFPACLIMYIFRKPPRPLTANTTPSLYSALRRGNKEGTMRSTLLEF